MKNDSEESRTVEVTESKKESPDTLSDLNSEVAE